jgi:hypothetical protein
MTTITVPTHVDEARTAKAIKIVEKFRATGVDAYAVAWLNADERSFAARQAGVREPSAITWQLVIGMMLETEAHTDRYPNEAACPGCEGGDPEIGRWCRDCSYENAVAGDSRI